MDIKQVKIADLKPAEYNPRKLSPEQESALKDSLSKFGIVDPVIVNSNPDRAGVIIGGHQRVKVWQKMGHDTVPVFYIDLDKQKERELNIRLNKNTGEFSWPLLEEFFQKDELMAWGFTEKDVFGRFKFAETIGDDDIPEKPASPVSKIGDLYQLGKHFLLCGDSTSQADVTRLIAGNPADMTFTDPPYNINYSGRGKNTSRTIENDNMAEADFRPFLTAVFKRINEATKSTAALYCCYASRTHREFEDAVNSAGYDVRNQIIWVKTVASMGWGDYRWKHEPMLYCVKKGCKVDFYADRTQTTTWDLEPTDKQKLEMFNKMVKKDEDGGSTVWRFSREFNYLHPTQKPVALVTQAILNSCKTNGIVLDLFGGSGSTLITAEKTGRQARLMELDPGFVDAIVKRYADFCRANEHKFTIIKNGTDITEQFRPITES